MEKVVSLFLVTHVTTMTGSPHYILLITPLDLK